MPKRKHKNSEKEEGHEGPKLKYKMDDEGRGKEQKLEMAEEMKLDLLDMDVSDLTVH